MNYDAVFKCCHECDNKSLYAHAKLELNDAQMMDEHILTRIKIAEVVGIRIEGSPPGMNWPQAVSRYNWALVAVVDELQQIATEHDFRFWEGDGQIRPPEPGSSLESALKDARTKIAAWESNALAHKLDYWPYAAGQARKYLDRLLQTQQGS